MPGVFEFIRSNDIPLMARPNYAAELRHTLLWGMFANLIDGSFSSIVVAKTFSSPLLVPVVWATPMLAHLLSLAWGAFVRGRPKIRTFRLLATCAAVSAGSIALTPSDVWWGGWLFALQIALARIFMSGLVTIRTSIWNANYPQSHRAQIAGRLQTLSALIMLAMGAMVSNLFDRHAEYYRYVYPALALFGMASLIPLRKIRMRGETRYLTRHREARPGGLLAGVREALGILRTDRNFARYCTAQYMLGSANFMTDPILTLFLTQTARLGYFHSYLIMDQIPTVLAVLSIRNMARLFDRVGVLRFRIVNSSYWLGSIVLTGLALACAALPLPGVLAVALGVLVLARVANGIGRGGGSIAWNLGHLHFAGAHDAELYMGIHVALTGLRGLIMPFVGTAVYGVAGPAALLLGMGLATGALLSFRRLAREYRVTS